MSNNLHSDNPVVSDDTGFSKFGLPSAAFESNMEMAFYSESRGRIGGKALNNVRAHD
jgi:hypothetical protein